MMTRIKVKVPLGRMMGGRFAATRLFTSSAMERIHRKMGLKLLQVTKQSFFQHGQFGGAPWQEYAESTKKRWHKHDPVTLIESGDMFGSVRFDGATSLGARVVAGDWKSSLHQSGGEGLPARPYFPISQGRLTPQAEREVVKAAQREIHNIVRGL